MLNLMQAEWIKLRSTKSLYITSILVLFFGLIVAGIASASSAFAFNSGNAEGANPGYISSAVLLVGLNTLGVLIIMIQAILNTTSEYAHNTQKLSILTAPTRFPLIAVKILVYGAYAVVLSFVVALLCLLTGQEIFRAVVKDEELVSYIGFSATGVWEYVGRVVLSVFLMVVLCTAVATLLRSTAGTISALLLWKLVIEGPILFLIPWVRNHFPAYAPMNNLDHFVMGEGIKGAPWASSPGQIGSLIYFLVWCIALLVVSFVVFKRRDA